MTDLPPPLRDENGQPLRKAAPKPAGRITYAVDDVVALNRRMRELGLIDAPERAPDIKPTSSVRSVIQDILLLEHRDNLWRSRRCFGCLEPLVNNVYACDECYDADHQYALNCRFAQAKAFCDIRGGFTDQTIRDAHALLHDGGPYCFECGLSIEALHRDFTCCAEHNNEKTSARYANAYAYIRAQPIP